MSIEADFRAFTERASRLRKEMIETERAFLKGLYIPDNPTTPEEKRVCELAKAAVNFAASISNAHNQLKKAGKQK